MFLSLFADLVFTPNIAYKQPKLSLHYIGDEDDKVIEGVNKDYPASQDGGHVQPPQA